MIEYRKQPDGTWKVFGVPFADQDRVSISLGNGDPGDSGLSSVLVGNCVPSALAGEHAYVQAVALVEESIRNGAIARHNVIMIEAADTRAVSDAFDLALHDRFARHAHELHTMPRVPPGFHDYAIDIYRTDSDIPFMRRVGCLELVQLIRDRLQPRFSGRICDQAGNILEQWTAKA